MLEVLKTDRLDVWIIVCDIIYSTLQTILFTMKSYH